MRPRIALTGVVVAVVVAVAACGADGPDISGFYAVTSESADSTGCGGETAVAAPPAFFMIKKDALFGKPFFSVYTCTAADAATCSPGDGLLVTPRDDGWHGFISFAAPGDGSNGGCQLGYIEYAALFDPSPATLRVETHVYSQRDAPVSPCTTAEAEQRSTSMPCVSSSTLIGALVAPQ